MTITTGSTNINWTNVSTFQDILNVANNSGVGYTFTMITFMVWATILITLAGPFGWEAAILSSGFIGMILSILFVYMGLMAWKIAGMFVGLLMVMIMYVIWSNKYD